MKKVSKALAIFTFCFAVTSLFLVIFHRISDIVDYQHQILLCAVSALLAVFPSLISRIFKITIHPFLRVYLYVYIVLGTLLGNIYNLYYILPFWDKLLHLFSGALLMCTAFMFIDIYTEKGYIQLNKTATILVALFFTLSVGVVWEFFEYAADLLLDANMQRYMLKDKTPLVGQAVLHDTMQDMLWAALGAVISCIGYAFIERREKVIDNVDEVIAESKQA